MKKSFLLTMFIFGVVMAYAENFLSGEVVVTNPRQLAITLNQEFPFGTTGRFSYDGESLSVELGGKGYKDVELTCGVGFKPDGENCFYVSLQDGIEMGAIKARGTGTHYGQSIELSANPSYKLNFCSHWIPNNIFVLKPSIAGTQHMVVRPKTDIVSIPKLILESKGEAAYKYSILSKGDETIEAYCIEHTNKVPSSAVSFSVDNSHVIDPAIFSVAENDALVNQIQVYSFVSGNTITADSIVAVITGTKAALLLIKNGLLMGNIVKYENGEFQSARHISFEHLKQVCDIDELLRDKKPNRIYISKNVDKETYEGVKLLYLNMGCKLEEDGSFSLPPETTDLDVIYELYAQMISPAVSSLIESWIQAMTY